MRIISSMVLLASFSLIGLLTSTYRSDANASPQAQAPKIGRIKRAGGEEEKTKPKTDADILKTAELKPDDVEGLIKYFKNRTLNDSQLITINSAIQRMGDEKYPEREKASREVVAFGAAALGPLKSAVATDPDPEIVYRSEQACIQIETVSQATVAIAAAKQLAKLKTDQAVPVLLAFLQSADNEQVADQLRESLTSLAMPNSQPSPVLIAALKDPNTIRRSAAAVALIEGGRTPESLTKVKAMIEVEKDLETKFAAASSLLTAAKDADATSVLIDMIPTLARGRVWQVEDMLLQLAGKDAPKAKYGKSKESLEGYRDEWRKWWADKRKTIDMTKFAYVPRTDGTLLIVEINAQGYGMGNVTLYGPNLKEKVKYLNLAQPMDAVSLPGNRIAIAEQNSARVTIRNTMNEVVKSFDGIQQPMNLQLLPNGKLFIIQRNGAAEYDLEGKKGWSYDRAGNNYDVDGARMMPNGEAIFFVHGDQKNNFVRIGKDGKEIGKPLPLGQVYYQPALEAVSNDEFYMTDYSKITKYNIKEKKAVWTHNASGVTCIQKLPNGNILYVLSNQNKVVELTPEKEEVWEHQFTSGMRLMKAYRR